MHLFADRSHLQLGAARLFDIPNDPPMSFAIGILDICGLSPA